VRSAAVAFLAALALIGCSGGGGRPAGSGSANPSGASASGGGSSSFDATNPPGGRLETANRSSDFKPGQCYTADGFVAAQSLEPTQLHAIGCDAPHRLEVDAVIQHPSAQSSAFPGAEALAAFTDDQCLEQFRSYVANLYEDSTLDIADIRPTERSWKAGDRTVVCLLYNQDFADLTGTVKGSGK
jgi:hypothetical protein